MKKATVSKLILSTTLLLGVLGLTGMAEASALRPVTAYALLAEPGTMALLQQYQNGSKPINFDRLDIAFLNPHLTTWQYGPGLQPLINAGVLTPSQASEDPSFDLKALITALHAKGVKVLISVGGWAYSNCKTPDYSYNAITCPVQGGSGFPLSPAVASASASIAYDPAIEQIDPNFSNIIQNWVNFTTSYGFDGIDLDYEESWYAAAYARLHPITNHAVSWATPSNGPLILPQSVIKLGLILHELETQLFKHSHALILTMAAPSVGAYDIHTAVNSGNFYWNPGDGNGNLKGVLYDLLHVIQHADVENTDFALYNSLGPIAQQFPYLLAAPKIAQQHNLAGMDNIGIMSYDLDDGDDTLKSSWCIGHGVVRDPADNIGLDVDCSIASQTLELVKMFAAMYQNTNGITPGVISFGLEVGFPNYPINLDPALPGGGSQSNDPHYRWNDPWVVYDIPMKSTEKLPAPKVLNNVHATYLTLDNAMFTQMQNAGANGVIVWSLNNSFYTKYLSKTNQPDFDYAAYLNKTDAVFGGNLSVYTWDGLGAIFDNAASTDDILNAAYQFYAKTQTGS